MKRSVLLSISLVFLFLSAMAGVSFGDDQLKTEDAAPAEVQGVYRLFLFGGNFLNDLRTVAILAKEETGYTFEPYAPAFDYRVLKEVPAKDALREAESFVGQHPSFSRSQLSRILDPKGQVIGYELRPLYRPFDVGVSDVLDVTYWLSNGKVVVRVRLIPSVERMIDGGGGFTFGHARD
ncbi:MAG: hypothetical protein WC291_06780 [Thermodesulfovibrionales bacterium]|jgi:hypothetical protein